MRPPQSPRAEVMIFCLLASITLLCMSEAEITIEGSVEYGKTQIVQFTCSFPPNAAPGHFLALRRRVYTDTTFRTMSTTNRTHEANVFRVSSSASGLSFNGSMVYTFQHAVCVDAGVYECHAVFTPRPCLFRRDESSDRANLEMIPSNPMVVSKPLLLDFKHLIPGTLIKLQCTVFSTLSLHGGWIWETARFPHINWSRVPNSVWVESSAPDINKRCFLPWKSTLTMEVTEKDVDRVYRCHVIYRYKNISRNSSYAVYTFKEHQMIDNPSQVMLTILVMACGTGIFIMGSILTIRSYTSYFPEMCSRVVSRIRHVFCHRHTWRHRHSRSSALVSHRRFSELMNEFDSHMPPVTAGGIDGEQDKPDRSMQDRGGDTLSMDLWFQDDAPGAEDDYWQDAQRHEVEEGNLETEATTTAIPCDVSPSAAANRGSASPLAAASPCIAKPLSELCVSSVPLSSARSNHSALISSAMVSSADTVRSFAESEYCASTSTTMFSCAVQTSSASMLDPTPFSSETLYGAVTSLCAGHVDPKQAASRAPENGVPTLSNVFTVNSTSPTILSTALPSPSFSECKETQCSTGTPYAGISTLTTNVETLISLTAASDSNTYSSCTIPTGTVSPTTEVTTDLSTCHAAHAMPTSAAVQQCDEDIAKLLSALPSPPDSDFDHSESSLDSLRH